MLAFPAKRFLSASASVGLLLTTCCSGGAALSLPLRQQDFALRGLFVDNSNLAISKSGRLYFSARWGSALWSLDPISGLRSKVPLSKIDRKPASVAVANDDDVWVALELPDTSKRDTIARVTNKHLHEYQLPRTQSPRHVSLLALTPDRDGLWFNNSSFARLGRIDSRTGQVTEHPTLGVVTALAVDAGGRVWTSENWRYIVQYETSGRLLHRFDFWRGKLSPNITAILVAGSKVWFGGVNNSVLGYVDARNNRVHVCAQHSFPTHAGGSLDVIFARYKSGGALIDEDGSILLAADDCQVRLVRTDGSAFVVAAAFDASRNTMWLLKKLASVEAIAMPAKY